LSRWASPHEGGATVEARDVGILDEKMSCLVPLRTYKFWEPVHRNLAPRSLLNGGETNVD
jgi:hypothetical protein